MGRDRHSGGRRSVATGSRPLGCVLAVVLALMLTPAPAGAQGGPGGGPVTARPAAVSPALASTATAPAVPPAGAASVESVGFTEPSSLTAGPDGSVWFLDRTAGVGRRLPDGHVVRVADVAIVAPRAIAVGPDGTVWLADVGSCQPSCPDTSAVVRIDPGGTATRVPVTGIDELGLPPVTIAAGPDGAGWVTVPGQQQVARVSVAGDVRRVDLSTAGRPSGITAGPDGNVWVSAVQDCSTGCTAGPALVRLVPSGAPTPFPLPVGARPSAIVPAGDGTGLWYLTGVAATPLGRSTLDGAQTYFGAATPRCQDATRLTTTADGAVWSLGSSVCRTFDGELAEVTSAGAADWEARTAGGLAAAPDLGVWLSAVPLWEPALGLGPALLVHVAADGSAATGPSGVLQRPTGAVTSPDGSVWVPGAGTIRRFAPDGTQTAFDDPRIQFPSAPVVGPDGNVWFTVYSWHLTVGRGDQYLVRVDPEGHLAFFRDVDVEGPWDPVAGPDGAVWFLNTGFCVPEGCWDYSIGRITPDGAISRVTSPAMLRPTSLAAGPDGNLWFTALGELGQPAQIGRVSPAGTVDVFADPGLDHPRDLVAGPDGNVWFANGTDQPGVGRITPAGVTDLFSSAETGTVDSLAAGPDGNMWAAYASDCVSGHCAGGGLLRVTPAGVLTPFTAVGVGGPTAIHRGSDGALWFGNAGAGPLGRIATDGSITLVPPSTFGSPDLGIQWLTPTADGRLWFAGTTSVVGTYATGVGVGAPGPATAVAGEPAAPGVTVSWAPPADDGGVPLASFTATAEPGGATCTAAAPATSCTIDALTVGVAYTSTVTTMNQAGPTSTSAVSAPVVAGGGPGSSFVPVTPFRALDTRVDPTTTGVLPIGAGSSRTLDVIGASAGKVPPTARAVVADVTVTGGTAASVVAVAPAGSDRPATASLVFAAGETVTNQVTVGLGLAGGIAVFNQLGSVHVVVDVLGYYDDGTGTAPGAGRFTGASPPVRLADSRDAAGPWGDAPLGAGTPRSLAVAGQAGVPVDATAVVVSVTVTGGTAASFLQVAPSGTSPGTANVLFAAGQTVGNLVTVGLGPDGAVVLTNSLGAVDVVVDVVGWYRPGTGAGFHPVRPVRVLDSRTASGVAGQWGASPLGPGATRDVVLGSVATRLDGMVGNLAATAGSGASYLTVSPSPGPAVPATATLLFAAGQTIPIGAQAGAGDVGAGPAVSVFNQQGTVDVVLDVTGFFAVDALGTSGA